MRNISKGRKSTRDIAYYRQRFRNRVFLKLVQHFATVAARDNVTKKDIAEALGRDNSQITRWLSNPSNLTLDTISDILLALDAEPEPPEIIEFGSRATPNFVHPLIARIVGNPYTATQQNKSRIDIRSRSAAEDTVTNKFAPDSARNIFVETRVPA